MRPWIALLALVVCACGDSGASAGDGDYMDDDLPMGGCAGSGSGGCVTGTPVGFPCSATQQCVDAAVCAAPFADSQAGDPVCMPQCIPLDYEPAWCLDSSACCDAGAVCSPRGLCEMSEPPSDETGLGSSGSANTGTGGEPTSTGADPTTGSGSGSSSGSGSDTGSTGSSSTG